MAVRVSLSQPDLRGFGSTGWRTVGIQTVEEVRNRPLGSEHVKSDMLPMLRNDLAFALRLRAASPPDTDGQAPLIAQTLPGRIVAPFGQLAGHPDAAQKSTSCATPPGNVEKHNGVRTFQPEIECFVVVAVGDPRGSAEGVTLRLAPLSLRRRNPAGLPEEEVEMD